MSLSINPPRDFPNEIWLQIFCDLQVKDAKNLRLCSRKHSEIGFRTLFRVFVFRTHDFDLYKLGLGSLKFPRVFSRVHKVIFEMGFVDLSSIFSLVNTKLDEGHHTDEEIHSVRNIAIEYLAASLTQILSSYPVYSICILLFSVSFKSSSMRIEC